MRLPANVRDIVHATTPCDVDNRRRLHTRQPLSSLTRAIPMSIHVPCTCINCPCCQRDHLKLVTDPCCWDRLGSSRRSCHDWRQRSAHSRAAWLALKLHEDPEIRAAVRLQPGTGSASSPIACSRRTSAGTIHRWSDGSLCNTCRESNMSRQVTSQSSLPSDLLQPCCFAGSLGTRCDPTGRHVPRTWCWDHNLTSVLSCRVEAVDRSEHKGRVSPCASEL
jgi:hypothetical protein